MIDPDDTLDMPLLRRDEPDLADVIDSLVDERDRLRTALDALVHAAEEFSTEANYVVAVNVEEDFVAVLDDARSLVAALDDHDSPGAGQGHAPETER